MALCVLIEGVLHWYGGNAHTQRSDVKIDDDETLRFNKLVQSMFEDQIELNLTE